MAGQPRIYCRGNRTAGPDWPGNRGSRQGPTPSPKEERGRWVRVRGACLLGVLQPIPHPMGMAYVWLEHALLWIDVEGRPEVADLGRVLIQEGAAEATSIWSYARDLAGVGSCVLNIEVQRPVRAAFSVAFPMPDTQRILVGIAHAHALFLCGGQDTPDPEDEEVAGVLYELIATPSPDVLAIEFDVLARSQLMHRISRWRMRG